MNSYNRLANNPGIQSTIVLALLGFVGAIYTVPKIEKLEDDLAKAKYQSSVNTELNEEILTKLEIAMVDNSRILQENSKTIQRLIELNAARPEMARPESENHDIDK